MQPPPTATTGQEGLKNKPQQRQETEHSKTKTKTNKKQKNRAQADTETQQSDISPLSNVPFLVGTLLRQIISKGIRGS